jgi:TolA-binding protein
MLMTKKIAILSLFGLVLLGTSARAQEDAETLFRFAEQLMLEREEYDTAARKLEEFLQTYPRHGHAPQAALYLGHAWSNLGKDREAAEAYERMLREYPAAADELRQEAMAYGGDARFRLGDYEQAIDLYTQLLDAYPTAPLSEGALFWRGDARYSLAGRAEAAGRAEEADALLRQSVADFEAFFRRYPESRRTAAALYNAGFAAYELEDYDRAVGFLGRLVEEFPEAEAAEEARFLLGECAYRQRRYAEAKAAYETLLRLHPAGPYAADARSGIAWCDLALGNTLAAAEGFSRAAEMASDPEKALAAGFDAAAAYRDADRLELAIAELEPVADAEGHPLRAKALFRLGHYRLERSKVLAAEAGAAADVGRADRLRAESRRLAERAVDALRTARQHPDIGPLATEAATFLGDAYLDLGQFAAAEPVFAEIAREHPADPRAPWALFHLALARQEQGDLAGAAEALGRLVGEYPQDRLRLQGAYARADYLMRLGRTDEARRAYEWVAQEGPAWARSVPGVDGRDALLADAETFAAEALFRLGESYYPDENRAEAARWFRAVRARYPDSPQAAMSLLRLGEVAEAGGDPDEAAAHYGAVLAAEPGRGALEKHALYRLGVVRLLQGQQAGEEGARGRLLRESRERLDAVLERYPQDDLAPKAHYYRAEALYALGETAAALRDYQAAYDAATEGELADAALFGLAWAERDLGRGGAAGTFRNLVTRFPESAYRPDALYLLATDRMKAGEYEAALADLETLLRTEAESDFAARALIEKGRALEALGRPAEAIETLNRFLDRHPDHPGAPRALYALSWAWWRVAEPKVAAAREAREAFEEATGGLPLEDLAGDRRESAARAKAEWEAARAAARTDEDSMVAVLRRLVREAPDFALVDAVHLRLGEVAYDRQDYAAAREAYEAALAAAATRPGSEVADKAQYRLAWSLLRQAEALEAEAEATGAAGEDPLLTRARETKIAAMRAFETLATEHPGSPLAPEGWFRAAEIRRRAGDYAYAATEYRNALRDLPPDATFARAARYGLGLALLKQGEPDAALEVFNRFLADWSRGDYVHEAHWGAGEASLALGATADAAEHFQAAIADDYGGEAAAKARYGLGMVAVSRGEWEAAREEFLKVEAFHSYWPEWAAQALLRASEAARETGDTAKARKDLEQILSHYPGTAAAQDARQALSNL